PTRPPASGYFSKTVTERPAPRSRSAATRPARPPPTTATLFLRAGAGDGASLIGRLWDENGAGGTRGVAKARERCATVARLRDRRLRAPAGRPPRRPSGGRNGRRPARRPRRGGRGRRPRRGARARASGRP